MRMFSKSVIPQKDSILNMIDTHRVTQDHLLPNLENRSPYTDILIKGYTQKYNQKLIRIGHHLLTDAKLRDESPQDIIAHIKNNMPENCASKDYDRAGMFSSIIAFQNNTPTLLECDAIRHSAEQIIITLLNNSAQHYYK